LLLGTAAIYSPNV